MQHKGKFRDVDGIILLDKPSGITSNSALQQTRSIFRAIKAGHTGSLDPLATGLLPICFGEATKMSGYLLDAHKHYRATCKLGVTTNTGDSEGEVLATATIPELNYQDLTQVLEGFIGKIMQVPPMYSAISIDGQRLYKLARAGKEVDRPAREVEIMKLQLVEQTADGFVVEVSCSKGTYIRTLLEDIGKELGCGAHMTALRRTGVSPFINPEMVTIAQLDDERDAGKDLLVHLAPLDRALNHLPALTLNADQALKITQGQQVKTEHEPDSGLSRLYRESGEFMGLGEYSGKLLKAKRLLRTN